MTLKKIILRSEDNKHEVQYQDERGIIYKELNENDFNHLLEKLKFNNDFALPDRLVQDFVNDGSIVPTFKRSIFFNKYDMRDIIQNIKPYKKRKKYHNLSKKKRKVKKPTKRLKRI